MVNHRSQLKFRFLERIPEVCYPWGPKAYRQRLDKFIAKYGIEGAQSYCIDLVMWHAFVHFVFSLAFVVGVHALREYSPLGAGLASTAFVAFFYWQEFIDQPRRLRQTFPKALLDFIVWSLPVAAYWVFTF